MEFGGREQHWILVGLLLREVFDAPEDRFWRMKLKSGVGGDEEKGFGLEDFYKGLGKRRMDENGDWRVFIGLRSL